MSDLFQLIQAWNVRAQERGAGAGLALVRASLVGAKDEDAQSVIDAIRLWLETLAWESLVIDCGYLFRSEAIAPSSVGEIITPELADARLKVAELRKQVEQMDFEVRASSANRDETRKLLAQVAELAEKKSSLEVRLAQINDLVIPFDPRPVESSNET